MSKSTENEKCFLVWLLFFKNVWIHDSPRYFGYTHYTANEGLIQVNDALKKITRLWSQWPDYTKRYHKS